MGSDSGSRELGTDDKVLCGDGISKSHGGVSLVTQVNCTTGKDVLVELPEDYDEHLEIARSAFADMLHDHDRNMRYYRALRYEISRMKAEGVEVVNVLDIGTGTGLLSMMAVQAGADNVFACDAFTPALECARKVVTRNGFAGRITLIPKRSTELVVGVDIPERCNLLVTEVFDTELIGEWAISTFNQAHAELLTEAAVVIPRWATVFAQVTCCDEVERWNSLPLEMVITDDVSLMFPDGVSRCPGVPSCQDIQLDGVRREEFTLISPPISVFKFDFNSKQQISKCRESVLEFEGEGKANAVFMWWDLDMDRSGGNVLSCQPGYVGEAVWRDHWMHSVYYIPRRESLAGKGVLYSAHDEYSFWFDVRRDRGGSSLGVEHPVCECGVHNVLSRYQIYFMNGVERYREVIGAMKGVVRGSVVVCFSDCSLLPVILANMGASKVFAVESCNRNAEFSKRFVEGNKVQGIVEVLEERGGGLTVEDFRGLKIDVVTGDPYFQTSTYAWNNLRFWYLAKSIPVELVKDPGVYPCRGVLKGLACRFKHLWKINAPVRVAAGEFDLTDFDNLINKSISIADSSVDAQPLWEYESVATSSPVTFIQFDLWSNPDERRFSSGVINTVDDQTNGIALWIDWEFSGSVVVSTGPIGRVVPGGVVSWERHTKQGVHFLNSGKRGIEYEIIFSDGDVKFSFK